MSNITFQNTKVNDGRANDTGVNSGTAVTLHNVKFTYTWKNLINADPVPQKQLSSTRKFGIAEVDVAGFENPRIIIEGVINVDNIEANEITVPLIQDFCKIKFDGTITTAIILVQQYGFFIPLLAALANLLFTWFALRNTELLFRIFGKHGSDAISRLMGLIILAIGVSFITSGWLG